MRRHRSVVLRCWLQFPGMRCNAPLRRRESLRILQQQRRKPLQQHDLHVRLPVWYDQLRRQLRKLEHQQPALRRVQQHLPRREFLRWGLVHLPERAGVLQQLRLRYPGPVLRLWLRVLPFNYWRRQLRAGRDLLWREPNQLRELLR